MNEYHKDENYRSITIRRAQTLEPKSSALAKCGLASLVFAFGFALFDLGF
jgi:hypothetical protein